MLFVCNEKKGNVWVYKEIMNVGCCKNYCGFIIDCKVRNSRKELIRVVIKILYDVRNIYGETNGKMEHED